MAIWIAISLWWVLLGFPPSVTKLWPSWPPPCCFFYYFPFPHCPSWKHRKIATFVQFCPGFGFPLFLSYSRRINQQKAILWPNHRTENMGLESELCNKTQNNSEKISSEKPTFLKFCMVKYSCFDCLAQTFSSNSKVSLFTSRLQRFMIPENMAILEMLVIAII